MPSALDLARSQAPADRQRHIVDAFVQNYRGMMAADPAAWRGKFRKMAASPFAFYRGSVVLFYADMASEDDPFWDERTSRVWIHGDLHCTNFGTYLNSAGILVFDLNDFDEAYVGPFTWDLKRLAASLALLGYEKALSDDEIALTIETMARAYMEQVAKFAARLCDRDFALTLSTTDGALLEVLRNARLRTRVDLLNLFTRIEDNDRRFILGRDTRPVDAAMRQNLTAAFERYVETIPPSKRRGGPDYTIKDVVLRRQVGIGSAALPFFSFLLEGRSQALENDIVIHMKQSTPAAPSTAIDDQRIASHFLHDGHRTALSQRALQAYSNPWVGWTDLDGVGQFVTEANAYGADLEWGDINDMDEIVRLVAYLGQAAARAHCVSDAESDQTIVPFSVDAALHETISRDREGFVAGLRAFGTGYGALARDDYVLFLDAFRNGMFPGM